ncbi:MAG: gliding motility-associated C-terminal domain-containing protein, partial [Bacteroidota bacterium]
SLFVTDPAVPLTAEDNGGEWSGNGIDPNSGEFNPENAGIGDHQIIYTIDQICGDADSTIIVVSEEQIEDLLIPDVLTPNGDDFNDTWRIQGIRAYDDVAVYIFTRWGDKVFEFTGTGDAYAEKENQWDGTHNGNKMPFGTYVYILELNNNNDETYKGTLTLIR